LLSPPIGKYTDSGYDVPRAYNLNKNDPLDVTGNTQPSANYADLNFYGYAYNWYTATAGTGTQDMDTRGENAPSSICPKGWRLPTGDPTGEFAWLNAKMNSLDATAPIEYSDDPLFYVNWLYSGPFHGVFSGVWFYSEAVSQGWYALLWSSIVYSGGYVFAPSFSNHNIQAGTLYGKDDSVAVRCLLK
jgi:uncharacterized protein (TIGR02145 family)